MPLINENKINRPAEDMTVRGPDHLLDDELPVAGEAPDARAAQMDAIQVVPVLQVPTLSS